MKHIPYYLFAFLLLTLSGCIEEFEADIPEEDSDLLVVEGFICSGETNTFILTRTQPVKSYEAPKRVTGAIISVRGTDGSEYRAQATDGNYTCWIDALSPDVEYYLHIETDGEVYESGPQKPIPTEQIADVRGVQDTPESTIDVLVTPDAPFNPNQANYYSWTYDETWEVHSDYTTNMYYDVETLTRVYQANLFPSRGWKDATSSTIMVGSSLSYEGQQIRNLKIYDIDRGDARMYHRYCGLVHQRAITKAEYEYDFARRQASSDMGGLFTPQPSSLPTNIRCLTSNKHVIGYVGCSLNTSEYRFFLDADDFSINVPQYEDAREWLINPSDNACLKMVRKKMHLCEWEDNRISFGDLKTAWATEKQLDVRYKGAYIEKPDFWKEKNEE